MLNEKIQSEKQLAVQRANYIKKLKITVKGSQKTQDFDQLIVIETYNLEKKQSVELIMRKLSQLDYFIEYLNEKYGGHIIPFIKSDFFFQNNIDIHELVPKIQQYLSDLQQNKYCRQDPKFYCFILQQNMNIPKAVAYNKVLNHATDFSRKYLSSLFARKAIPHFKDTQQYIESYSAFTNCYKIYQSIRQASILKLKQTLQIQDIISLFTDFNSTSQIAIEPQQIQIEQTWKIIKICDKLIKQANQAHSRWQILIQHARQLENNVCKGLHEDTAMLQKKSKQVKLWSQSLSFELLELCDYLQKKMQKITLMVKNIYRSVIMQSMSIPDEINTQQRKSSLGLEQNHRLVRKSIENQINQYERQQKNEHLRKSSSQVKI